MRCEGEQRTVAVKDLVDDFAVGTARIRRAIGVDGRAGNRHDPAAFELDPHILDAGSIQELLDVVVADARVKAVGVAEDDDRARSGGVHVDGIDELQDVLAACFAASAVLARVGMERVDVDRHVLVEKDLRV